MRAAIYLRVSTDKQEADMTVSSTLEAGFPCLRLRQSPALSMHDNLIVVYSIQEAYAR